jgi:GTPase SAR1 family protein
MDQTELHIALVGARGVGKTSIAQRYCSDAFDQVSVRTKAPARLTRGPGRKSRRAGRRGTARGGQQQTACAGVGLL